MPTAAAPPQPNQHNRRYADGRPYPPARPCRHCGWRARSGRQRGLCRHCYDDPAVRDQYPVASPRMIVSTGSARPDAPDWWPVCGDCGGRIAETPGSGQRRCSTCLRPDVPGPGGRRAYRERIERYARRAAAGRGVFDGGGVTLEGRT
jgi:ribosomal protein S14